MKALNRPATVLSWLFFPGLILNCHAQDRGIFLIQQDERFGYINKSGRILVPPTFEEAGQFHEGLARVRIASKWGYVHKSGKIMIGPQFDAAGDFSEGLAAAQIEKQFGYIDTNGRFVIKAEYQEAWPFSQGLGLVKKAGRYGYVDRAGEVVIPFRFEGAGDFAEGLGLVLLAGKYGYIDKTGKIVIEPQFELAGGFSEGFARVVVNDKVGFIDQTGIIKIFPQFDSAAPFSEGLAVIQVGGAKLGYINKNGQTVIQPRFSMAGQFSEGLAPVSVGSHGGFIDTNGKMVIESVWFDTGQAFFDGLALMETSYGLAYVDHQGRYVWKEKIRPLPEIIKAIKERPLSEKQKRNSRLFKEYESQESLIDRVAKAKRGENISFGRSVLAPDAASLPDLAIFLQDLGCDSDAIVEGVLTSELTLFTHSGKFMFTEFELKVEDVFKNNKSVSIGKDQPITVIRTGGRLTIAGRTVSAYIGASIYPKPGERYLLFLRYLPSTNSYRAWVNGSFKIDGNSMTKLSPNMLWKSNETTSAAEFVRTARKSVAEVCMGRSGTRLADR